MCMCDLTSQLNASKMGKCVIPVFNIVLAFVARAYFPLPDNVVVVAGRPVPVTSLTATWEKRSRKNAKSRTAE